jgi:hypothetical protein
LKLEKTDIEKGLGLCDFGRGSYTPPHEPPKKNRSDERSVKKKASKMGMKK